MNWQFVGNNSRKGVLLPGDLVIGHPLQNCSSEQPLSSDAIQLLHVLMVKEQKGDTYDEAINK